MKYDEIDIVKGIIKEMILLPTNPTEIGFNCALLKMLRFYTGIAIPENTKEIVNDTIYRENNEGCHRHLSSSEVIIKNLLGDTIFYTISKEDFDYLFNEIKSDRKLNGVKHLKSISGLGLKEAKDIVDELVRRTPQEW